MKFAPDGSRGSSWPSPADGDPGRAGAAVSRRPVPDWYPRRWVTGSGVTLVQVRADSSVCPRGSGAPEQGDAFGAVRHVSV